MKTRVTIEYLRDSVTDQDPPASLVLDFDEMSIRQRRGVELPADGRLILTADRLVHTTITGTLTTEATT